MALRMEDVYKRQAFAFALGELCLNVNQQLERLLLGRLLLVGMVFCFSCNHCFQFVLAKMCIRDSCCSNRR